MLAPRTAFLLLLVTCCPQVRATAADVVVVCPPRFRQALGPWLSYRRAEGYEIELIGGGPTAADVRRRVRRVAATGSLQAVVLVGDCDARPDDGSRESVPTTYVAADAIPRYGGEQEIATDNAYGDLDGDHIPDVAVGRLSVEDPQQLATIVRKIIAYETSQDFGPWRRQINLVAGGGGFGPLVDGLIEHTTRVFLAGGIPAAYHTSLTHASWTSPYCPDPRKFSQTTLERLNEGCLFWIYMGHGRPHALDHVNLPDRSFPILTTHDLARLACPSPGPVALFISCYAGAFDAPQACLAEQMVRHPRGPVAVVAGSRLTLPYAMAVLGAGLMTECFQSQRPTLGELLVRAKQRAAALQPPDARRAALDSLGRLFSGSREEMAGQRRDHLHLFNLVGDPLLRLYYPQPVRLEVPPTASPGETITVTGHTPLAGRATLELVVRRDRLTFSPPPRKTYQPQEKFLADFDEVYRQANDPRLAVRQVSLDAGEFQLPLAVPPDALGPCHVRMYIQGRQASGMGAVPVEVHKGNGLPPRGQPGEW